MMRVSLYCYALRISEIQVQSLLGTSDEGNVDGFGGKGTYDCQLVEAQLEHLGVDFVELHWKA